MKQYKLSSESAYSTNSPISIWNLENPVNCLSEGNTSYNIYRNNENYNLYYMHKVMHWFWDPSSLSVNEALPSASIQFSRQNVKRSTSPTEPYYDTKSSCFDLYEALRQTEIPSVPPTTQPLYTTYDNATTRTASESLVPNIDYFSNGIFHYSNGVFQRCTQLTEQNLHTPEIFWDDLLSDSEEDSENESVYSLLSDEQDGRNNIQSQLLKDYNCPICYESPTNPVSTICGHVFCEKCIKRIFRLEISKWRCPQCRKALDIADYHPLYLP